MSTLTPNMNLNLPTIGVDSGLTWENDINNNAVLIDQHNHTSGYGVQISPAGLNINADLPINGNNLLSLRSVRFNAQSAPLSLPTDLGCLYVSGVDLYFNDENGNQIQITSGGTVNATSSGISSGTATASFSTSVLVVNSASNTPANIQGASILLGNTGVSGSKYVTLSPPSSLASNYSLTLPLVPSTQSFVTIDSSGNFGTPMPYVRSTGNVVGVGGIAKSSSSSNFTTTSTLPTYVNVTNLSVTITTTGRPVNLLIQPDGSNAGFINSSSTNGVFLQISRGATVIGNASASSNTGPFQSFGSFSFVDIPSAGTYTYTVQLASGGGSAVGLQNCVLVAWEQ